MNDLEANRLSLIRRKAEIKKIESALTTKAAVTIGPRGPRMGEGQPIALRGEALERALLRQEVLRQEVAELKAWGRNYRRAHEPTPQRPQSATPLMEVATKKGGRPAGFNAKRDHLICKFWNDYKKSRPAGLGTIYEFVCREMDTMDRSGKRRAFPSLQGKSFEARLSSSPNATKALIRRAVRSANTNVQKPR